jgi:3-oxoadipate enol-lactonase
MRVDVGGSDLWLEDDGAGPPILFLHAFPLDSRMWDGQVGALRDAFRTVRFDVSGFGASDLRIEVTSMEGIAADAVRVLDARGIPSAVVVGCSMGGYAALALVRHHPARVRALVLHDTRAEADTPDAREKRVALADRVLREGLAPVVEAFLPKVLGATTRSGRPALVDRVRRWMGEAEPAAVAAALRGLALRADATGHLAEIGVPTLVVCGEEDEVTPLASSQRLADGIPGARLAVIPEAGHLSNLENPRAFDGALRAFLDDLPT